MKVFKCSHCGKVVVALSKESIPTSCCNEVMEELIPNTTDAAKEKHVPQVIEENNKLFVKVGELEHPMIDVHFIEWIAVLTDQGYKLKSLRPGNKPEATFALQENEIVLEVLAYCNLHGLWKNSLE